jgi:hypothetical protein
MREMCTCMNLRVLLRIQGAVMKGERGRLMTGVWMNSEDEAFS